MFFTLTLKSPEVYVRRARVFVMVALGLASIQFLGNYFKIDFLRKPVPGLVPMNMVTSVGIILLSLAYLLRIPIPQNDTLVKRNTARVLVFFVMLSCIWRFWAYMLRGYIEMPVLADRNSISISTTICGFASGFAMLLVNSKRPHTIKLVQYLVFTVFLFAIFSIFINSYHAQSFVGIFKVPMTFYGSVCYSLVAVAILFVNTDKGLMKTLSTPYAGSLMARRLIPVSVLFPFIYGYIRLYGEWHGFYNKEFGTALAVMAVCITCIAFLFYNARLLNKRDALSDRSKEDLKQANHFLDAILENIPHMIFVKDAKELRFVRFNKAGEELLGYSREDLIGKSDYDFFSKEQADFFTDKDRIVLDKSTMIDLEEPIMTKSGERWLHTKKIPIKDSKGRPLYLVGISEDITERRKIDEELRQLNTELEKKVMERTQELTVREQRFRKLLENNYETITLIDANSQPIYRSPAAERMTGWSNDERRKEGGPMDDTHPDDLEKMKALVVELRGKPGIPVAVDFRTRHKDGHYVWLEGFMTNMFHDESLKGVLGNFRDVTERKLYEAKLEESERKYRQLFENNPLPMFIVNIPEYRFLDVNSAAIEHYGYSKEEFLTLTAMDIRPKDDLDRFREVNQNVYEGPSNRGIWRHLKKDGEIIHVEISIHIVKYEGTDVCLVLSNDVTAKLQAEQKLRNSLKDLSDYRFALDESSLITITDHKGVINYTNDNFCKISKYSAEELIGQDHRILNSGYHTQEFMGNMWDTIGSGKIWRGELRNKAKDSSIYWVDTTIVPFLNEQGQPYQYLAIRQDITEKKKAEEEINNLTVELRQLLGHIQSSREEERKYIAREIHDELGSALTALKIDVTMMQRSSLKWFENADLSGKSDHNGSSKNPEQSLTTPGTIADEFSSIINQLDKSIDSVKKISTELRPEILDHLGIIEAIKWRVQQFKNITGIPCKLTYLPEIINLDKEQSTTVYRTVQEALTNIARHAKATSVDVMIRKEPEYILIEVTDNGAGITEDKLKSGKSLGLIGMRERIHLLKGTLTINGAPGIGTTVKASIPI